MIKLLNMDNMHFDLQKETDNSIAKCDMVVADYIYENKDFSWLDKYWHMLRPDGGILIAITDYHSSAEYKTYVEKYLDGNFVNWLVWKNEWGNHGRKQFSQVHDDIIIFSRGSRFRFNPDKAQVAKITANAKGLNPSGRMTKVATSVITDITLTTGAKERIKDSTGKLIRWQKPVALLKRIMSPFLIQNDVVVDPYAGSGACGVVCAEENWHYIGIEYDKSVFKVAQKSLKPYFNDKEIIPF